MSVGGPLARGRRALQASWTPGALGCSSGPSRGSRRRGSRIKDSDEAPSAAAPRIGAVVDSGHVDIITHDHLSAKVRGGERTESLEVRFDEMYFPTVVMRFFASQRF